MKLTEGIRNALKTAAAALKGHARRVFMAQVVRDMGRGGQRQAQAQLGWSRDTIRKGEHELRTGIQCVDARSATGAKPIDARLPNLRKDIRDLVDGQSQTDPRFESERVYCKLSAAKVVQLLIERKGYTGLELPSNETIRNILNTEGYTLRKVQKTKPKKKIPQTDAIFEQIDRVNREADESDNQLRVSVDCKATVKIGQFSRGGTCRVKVAALDHDDTPDATLVPIGMLVPQIDEVAMVFVRSPATSDAIMDAIDGFWRQNAERFGGIDTLVLNLDNGPDNHSRRTQFIQRVVEFVDEHQITVRLAYYPPYHSKYNPVERVWGVLENEWNGDLLDTIPAALGHAQAMTWNGNHPVVRFVDKVYECGKKLGAAAMRALEKRLQRMPGLAKWFVDVVPRPTPG